VRKTLSRCVRSPNYFFLRIRSRAFERTRASLRASPAVQGSAPVEFPVAAELRSASDANLLSVGELRQQCRALGLSTDGRREELAAALSAVMGGQRRPFTRTTRAQTSVGGMRSHRSAISGNGVHGEMAGRALVGAMSRVKEATGQAWNWHSPPKNHLNDPTAMMIPPPRPSPSRRAATSVPGKRGHV
jgi:hypothetical protein